MEENPELRSLTGDAGIDDGATPGLLDIFVIVGFALLLGNVKDKSLRSVISPDKAHKRFDCGSYEAQRSSGRRCTGK